MTDLADRFDQVMDSMAGLARYPYPERHADWRERLAVNLPELAIFENLRPHAELGHLVVPPLDLAPGTGSPIDDTADVAAIARACHLRPQNAAAPALAALASAHEQTGLHAFITLASAAALEEAAGRACAALRTGATQPLLGVPVAIKDLMPVAGLPQTNGTGGVAAPAPAHTDALAVSRLRQAGAIMLGTANLHELAYGITSNNPHYGAVRNPRNPDFLPGGSSGGSAAAVAAGIVRLALGTDTGGSVRIPAACCGVVGFKPSFDAIPRDGVQPLGASLDHLGPIAASVADAALMFAVMAGQPPAGVSRSSLAGLRVGVPEAWFMDPLAPDVERTVRGALARMREDGAELRAVTLPGVEACGAVQFVTLCSEATDQHWQRLVEHPETLGPDVRARLEVGQFLPATWYTRAQRARADLVANFAATMQQVDVLVTPTLRVEPPRNTATCGHAGERKLPLHTAMTALTLPFNLTGMPALSLPCGRGDHGLPIGLQLVGARGDDWHVLAIAARIEELLGRIP